MFNHSNLDYNGLDLDYILGIVSVFLGIRNCKLLSIDATVPGMVAVTVQMTNDSEAINVNPHPKLRIEKIVFSEKIIKLVYLV